MDKKNMIIGAVLLLAALAVFKFAPSSPPPTKPATSQPAISSATPATTASGTTAAPSAPATGMSSTAAAVHLDSAEAHVTILANDFIEARFTNFGGALREVAFKKHAAVQGEPEPFVFNHLHQDPILTLTGYPGLSRDTVFEPVASAPNKVVYRAVIDGKIEVTRTYQLVSDAPDSANPYRILHSTTIRNLTKETLPLPRLGLTIGTAALLNERDTGQYLSVVDFDGSDPSLLGRGDFEGGGVGSLVGAGKAPRDSIEKTGSIVWTAVKNQFFTSLYTPEKPGIGIVAQKIDLSTAAPFADARRANVALTATTRFDLPALGANETATLNGALYVGPQEYRRLESLEHHEDRVLPYTQYFFNRIFLSRWVAPLENTLLNLAHRWLGHWAGSWGVAVILMTLMLKIVSLPFTLAASRSAKRMAKLQPELKAIREKHKDNPQKQQAATMELFKAHKVNPVGGCVPVLITMPLFIGFYAMLQSAAELRFQPFLWAVDLSAPDTIGHVFGFPVNIMPLLMGATMIFQMRLTPQPAVDNAQATMMKFMPVIFIAFCYNFSCALALYSTINGIFTIGQQLVINRMRDDGDPAGKTTVSPSGKLTKNVTPGKKK